MIKLTYARITGEPDDNKELWIDEKRIIKMERAYSSYPAGSTLIHFDNSDYNTVKETPEQILTLINPLPPYFLGVDWRPHPGAMSGTPDSPIVYTSGVPGDPE